MRERDLLALEFDKVLQLVASYALSAAGHEACLALQPQIAEPVVKEDSERTWQCFRLLEERLHLPIRPFPDIRPTFEWVDHGGAALEGLQLLDILEVVTLSRTLGTFFRREAAGKDLLKGYAVRLPSFPDLEATLRRCLDENGKLKDEASPTLRSLRRQIRTVRDDIEQRLQHTLRPSQAKVVFPDHYAIIQNNLLSFQSGQIFRPVCPALCKTVLGPARRCLSSRCSLLNSTTVYSLPRKRSQLRSTGSSCG